MEVHNVGRVINSTMAHNLIKALIMVYSGMNILDRKEERQK